MNTMTIVWMLIVFVLMYGWRHVASHHHTRQAHRTQQARRDNVVGGPQIFARKETHP